MQIRKEDKNKKAKEHFYFNFIPITMITSFDISRMFLYRENVLGIIFFELEVKTVIKFLRNLQKC